MLKRISLLQQETLNFIGLNFLCKHIRKINQEQPKFYFLNKDFIYKFCIELLLKIKKNSLWICIKNYKFREDISRAWKISILWRMHHAYALKTLGVCICTGNLYLNKISFTNFFLLFSLWNAIFHYLSQS